MAKRAKTWLVLLFLKIILLYQGTQVICRKLLSVWVDSHGQYSWKRDEFMKSTALYGAPIVCYLEF